MDRITDDTEKFYEDWHSKNGGGGVMWDDWTPAQVIQILKDYHDRLTSASESDELSKEVIRHCKTIDELKQEVESLQDELLKAHGYNPKDVEQRAKETLESLKQQPDTVEAKGLLEWMAKQADFRSTYHPRFGCYMYYDSVNEYTIDELIDYYNEQKAIEH